MGYAIKSFPFEMKLNESKRTIEGYASTHGNKDQGGDVVEFGAFRKTLKERGPQPPDQPGRIKFLWQHAEAIGRPIRMEEDSKGLYVEAFVSNTQLGNDALTLVKDGVIDAMSIGYDVLQDDYDVKSNTRYLKELKLYEFSLVTFPMNEEATVSGVKSMNQLTNMLKNATAADVSRFLKEGRKLNSTNEKLIRDAIRALEAVLEIAEPDDDEEEENASKSTLYHSSKPLDIYNGLDTKALQDILTNLKTGEN